MQFDFVKAFCMYEVEYSPDVQLWYKSYSQIVLVRKALLQNSLRAAVERVLEANFTRASKLL